METDGEYLYLCEYVKIINTKFVDVYDFTKENSKNQCLQTIIEVVRDALTISPNVTHKAQIVTDSYVKNDIKYNVYRLVVEIFVDSKLYGTIRDLYDETTGIVARADVCIDYYK